MEVAYEDPKFYCHSVDRLAHLKSDGNELYYIQVQGQLALTGLEWCDFVVYFSGSHSLNVELIQFNQVYWNETVLPKLKRFCFEHAPLSMTIIYTKLVLNIHPHSKTSWSNKVVHIGSPQTC